MLTERQENALFDEQYKFTLKILDNLDYLASVFKQSKDLDCKQIHKKIEKYIVVIECIREQESIDEDGLLAHFHISEYYTKFCQKLRDLVITHLTFLLELDEASAVRNELNGVIYKLHQLIEDIQ